MGGGAGRQAVPDQYKGEQLTHGSGTVGNVWLQNQYFSHMTRHNGLEKTIMQGMVDGEISGRIPRQRWERYITYMPYVWCEGSSTQNGGG